MAGFFAHTVVWSIRLKSVSLASTIWEVSHVHWHLSPKPQLISWQHIAYQQSSWRMKTSKKSNFIKIVFVSIGINKRTLS